MGGCPQSICTGVNPANCRPTGQLWGTQYVA